MGMVAEYFRMTPAELARAIDDHEWALEFTEANDERGYDTDKVWDALRVLLHRCVPADPCPFLGGTPFGDEWGYGRPRALTAEQVRATAELLCATPFDRLLEAYDEESLREAYFGPWSRDDVTELRETFDDLVSHFAGAASAGDAMILCLS